MSVIVSNGISNNRDREIWQLDTGIMTTPSPVLNTDTLTFTHRGLFVPQDDAAPYQDYTLDLMVDINAGVLWPLKFDPLPPTSLYQWIALSQPSQFAETLADEGVASTTYVNPVTAGPTITLPLPGEYRPQLGARSWHSSGQYGYMSFDWSGSGRSTANMDDDAHKWMGGVANMANTGSRKRPARVLPGNIAITAKYRTESGGNVGFAARWMEFNAIRVGTR
jgi:hypothetical protein